MRSNFHSNVLSMHAVGTECQLEKKREDSKGGLHERKVLQWSPSNLI